MTTTHTHVYARFANPYMVCDVCNEPVNGYITPQTKEGDRCEHEFELTPCRHRGASSICPSWSPVDGCQCIEHLGKCEHDMMGRALG